MKVKSFTFNPFQENTYIVYDNSKECIIIDPGCYTNSEEKQIEDFIIKEELVPVMLINTHCHIDHILGNKFVHETWGLQLNMHKQEAPVLESSDATSKMYALDNFKGSNYPKTFLNENKKISFGETTLSILFTPGHSPGHICLYSKKNNLIISGDLIFKGSIGRTDLPGGDYNTIIQSINSKIIELPNETKIFCGHGPSTYLENEKKNNPFLNL